MTTPRLVFTGTRISASVSRTRCEAVRAGAKQIDGSCRRFGAGAGNAPVEALIGVFDKIGVKAQCVYVVDSAGSLIMDGVSDRIAALVAELGDDAQVGFHGHENLGLGVANSVLAARAGAKQIDGSTRRFGAGAGNTPVEAFAAVTERLGIKTGIDTLKIIDAAEETVAPVLASNPPALDRLSLTMGYAGVYSSFLRHAEIQAKKYGVSGAEILIEAGRRKLVGGQEDQLIEIAVGLAKRKSQQKISPNGGG